MLYQWSGETGIIIIKVFCCFCLFFVIFSSKIGTFWLKFEEEIRRSECRKWRFRASNFKNIIRTTLALRVLQPRSLFNLDPPLAMYVSKQVHAFHRTDLKVESCWIEILQEHDKPSIIVGCIYGHPSANLDN